MAYRTFHVHVHLMHLYTHGMKEGKQEQTKNGKAACRPQTWQNLRLLVSEVSSAPPLPAALHQTTSVIS